MSYSDNTYTTCNNCASLRDSFTHTEPAVKKDNVVKADLLPATRISLAAASDKSTWANGGSATDVESPPKTSFPKPNPDEGV